VSSAQVTQLLLSWAQGDQQALNQLVPLVYDECRRIAEKQLRRERDDHTLNPTALVNELYIRLVEQQRTNWQNRAQFFGIAAQLMRRILVDHARARHAKKRGASALFVTLSSADKESDEDNVADVLAINEALERLALIDPDQVRMIELRFFAGLTVDETAHVLGRSPRTVKREWRLAKAWLYRELRG
jgi:RNA polymerase sigma-70 factor, ECF subfamily